VHGLGHARVAVLSERTPALPPDLEAQVRRALAEDVGTGDLTAALVPAERLARARIVSREDGVLCGTAWAEATFRALDPRAVVNWVHRDGARIGADTLLCTVEGPARALLTGERTALNFLQTLSGTATAARRHADAVAHTGCQVLDTRKTIPGLRTAQKYAVACGGGTNHRMGLYDAILIKENHIAAAGSIAEAVKAARRTAPGVKLEVEVETLAELDEAIAAGVELVLLDEFSLDELRAAVARSAGRVRLEASGGMGLDGLAAVAATGVDFVSVGALTKHVRALDLSMRFEA
jgi:nicotinate-nucleotide pyrophosphorylase (carboxylating)